MRDSIHLILNAFHAVTEDVVTRNLRMLTLVAILLMPFGSSESRAFVSSRAMPTAVISSSIADCAEHHKERKGGPERCAACALAGAAIPVEEAPFPHRSILASEVRIPRPSRSVFGLPSEAPTPPPRLS